MTLIRPRFLSQWRYLTRLLILSCLGLLSPQMRSSADDAMTSISVGGRACLFLDDRFVVE